MSALLNYPGAKWGIVNAKAIKAKAMMYKRPALASMGYDAMVSELYEIQEWR